MIVIRHETFYHPVEVMANCNYCKFVKNNKKRFKKAKKVCFKCGRLYGMKQNPSVAFTFAECDICRRMKPCTPVESFNGLMHVLIDDTKEVIKKNTANKVEVKAIVKKENEDKLGDEAKG